MLRIRRHQQTINHRILGLRLLYVRGRTKTSNYSVRLLFDFHQEHFVLRFVRGQMWYWMAGFPAQQYVEQYRRDNRICDGVR